MKIRCEATKRFLCKINIEEYYENIKKLGIDITIPLKLEIPCQRCKMVEVYEVYPNKVIHIESYKNRT